MYFAVISGLFAALGSFFGKLSGLDIFADYWIVRLFCIILMLLCNACVWRNYVKALHQCDSTITATIISTASNYIVSVLAGTVIFGEATSLMWWTGFTFIVIGLGVIVQDDNKIVNNEKMK